SSHGQYSFPVAMRQTNSPAVVVDTSRSRHTRLRPVPLTAVRLTDDFWEPRRRLNRTVTLPSQYQHCEATGRLDNFRRASGQKDVPFQGMYFNDSDVYKWLEATAWTVATEGDPALAAMMENVVREIAAAQQSDGYLNTYFMFDKAGERWTNLQDSHEMYCAGHLMQAAVAHHRATGGSTLLAVACRCADHICAAFGPETEHKRPGTDGHPEIEMALVELARTTGNGKYLEQAAYLLSARGHGLLGGGAYLNDHYPFRDLAAMDGHAVRAVYLNAGAADIYSETGEVALRVALDRLWHNMTTRRMYISGGLGARYQGEAFGKDYELPNARAYAETCAAIGSVLWNWRMLQLAGDARYAELMETTLYNAVLPGLSLDGQSYFYQNPLADDGTHRRQPWFGCACCPPNIARMLASLPGYFYSVADEGIWTHLYAAGTADIALPDGRMVRLTQRTPYPLPGALNITVAGEGVFSLFLRIPSWHEAGDVLRVNGEPFASPLTPGGYVEIRRDWTAGDVVQLDLSMPPRRMECHPYAAENLGRVALMQGPLLYCLEQVDNPDFDLRDIVLPARAEYSSAACHGLPDGVPRLRFTARLSPPAEWNAQLYRRASAHEAQAVGQDVQVRAIPYYAWANREPGAMQVWLRTC
ncbi:MAG TPA: beta-L-arabinofuranosidase domain-containing protein, partial [Abditibacteriaceae bacterium]|nr:beta-L-arabinofuranosidase domain-containing protein [Abditibacteriaceae bacterium]